MKKKIAFLIALLVILVLFKIQLGSRYTKYNEIPADKTKKVVEGKVDKVIDMKMQELQSESSVEFKKDDKTKEGNQLKQLVEVPKLKTYFASPYYEWKTSEYTLKQSLSKETLEKLGGQLDELLRPEDANTFDVSSVQKVLVENEIEEKDFIAIMSFFDHAIFSRAQLEKMDQKFRYDSSDARLECFMHFFKQSDIGPCSTKFMASRFPEMQKEIKTFKENGTSPRFWLLEIIKDLKGQCMEEDAKINQMLTRYNCMNLLRVETYTKHVNVENE